MRTLLLGAALLAAFCGTHAQAQTPRPPFLIERETAFYDLNVADPSIAFRLVFNQVPDFTIVDALGRQEFDFQYKTPDAVIRGPELHVSGDMLRIRAISPPDDSDPLSGGWGAVIGSVPWMLSGKAVTFSIPYQFLNANGPQFSYSVFPLQFGAGEQFLTGATIAGNPSTIPEPSTWGMMLAGFAGLGVKSLRGSRGPAAGGFLRA